MPRDALDDLLDRPAEERDVFRDVDTNMDVPMRKKNSTVTHASDGAFGLGIDEEVKISKKRKPIAKLDDDRLLSQAGIPKLRRIAKERLRFKGKGHEYSDVARLLNIYQLWLDDLYPRAKFADGLAIIEKLGHSKRIQTMRREWIDEAKPHERLSSDSRLNTQASVVIESRTHAQDDPDILPSKARSRTPTAINLDDDELYSATPRKNSNERRKEPEINLDESLFVSDVENDNSPSGDELDAILAEEDNRANTGASDYGLESHPPTARKEIEPVFDDEMDAMAEMDSMW